MNLVTNITKSAGVVIIRYDKDIPKVLLMRAFDYWEFPKGKLEGTENKLMAAIREVKEESGINQLDFKWGKAFYETRPYGKDRKIVSYFIAETKEKKVTISPNPVDGGVEHEEYRWVTFEEARKLTGERINKVLDWAEHRICNLYTKKSSYA